MRPEDAVRAILGQLYRLSDPVDHVLVPSLVLLRSKILTQREHLQWGASEIRVRLMDRGRVAFPNDKFNESAGFETMRITSVAVHESDWLEAWILFVDRHGLIVLHAE